ncbi:hypothetical protein [Sporomusa termitida]|nr:hypothetical protein [Sporomusa termitida]
MGIQVWGGEWYDCPAIDAIFTKEEWEEGNNVYLAKQGKKIPQFL